MKFFPSLWVERGPVAEADAATTGNGRGAVNLMIFWAGLEDLGIDGSTSAAGANLSRFRGFSSSPARLFIGKDGQPSQVQTTEK
jgi:hypothetical protein